MDEKEPTIVFLFNVKSWFESINPLSKIDLLDIVPFVSTQFYFDHESKAYLLILTKTKWDSLDITLKKKFMFISYRLKAEMEGPLNSIKKEEYENSDIFEYLMQKENEKKIEKENEKKLFIDDEQVIIPDI